MSICASGRGFTVCHIIQVHVYMFIWRKRKRKEKEKEKKKKNNKTSMPPRVRVMNKDNKGDNWGTVRAPVFGRHQFFGTSEHYGKAHGSLLSGWMNYNYTACCWFTTSSNILILPSQFWQIRFESCWLLRFKVPNTGAFTVIIEKIEQIDLNSSLRK